MQNKIFTTLNQPLPVQIYTLPDQTGDPITWSTLNGLPLGTSDNSASGEIAVKVVIVGQRPGDGGISGGNGLNDSGPAANIVPIVPDDTDPLPHVTRGILVNGAGDMAVTDAGGNTTTITDIVAGSLLPIQVVKVFATGTTATDLFALY